MAAADEDWSLLFLRKRLEDAAARPRRRLLLEDPRGIFNLQLLLQLDIHKTHRAFCKV
jgi:hypothetical protein